MDQFHWVFHFKINELTVEIIPREKMNFLLLKQIEKVFFCFSSLKLFLEFEMNFYLKIRKEYLQINYFNQLNSIELIEKQIYFYRIQKSIHEIQISVCHHLKII